MFNDGQHLSQTKNSSRKNLNQNDENQDQSYQKKHHFGISKHQTQTIVEKPKSNTFLAKVEHKQSKGRAIVSKGKSNLLSPRVQSARDFKPDQLNFKSKSKTFANQKLSLFAKKMANQKHSPRKKTTMVLEQKPKIDSSIDFDKRITASQKKRQKLFNDDLKQEIVGSPDSKIVSTAQLTLNNSDQISNDMSHHGNLKIDDNETEQNESDSGTESESSSGSDVKLNLRCIDQPKNQTNPPSEVQTVMQKLQQVMKMKLQQSQVVSPKSVRVAVPVINRRPTIWKLEIEAKAAMSNTNRASRSSIRKLTFDPVQFRQNLQRQIKEQTDKCLASKGPSIVPLFDYTFVQLPSFKATVLIFTFLDFQEAAMRLIGVLSKRARVFKIRHRDKLQSELVDWQPPNKVTTLDYGQNDLPWNFETFPQRTCQNGEKITQVLVLARYGEHPSRLHFSKFSKRLRGIQIRFSDGMETQPLPQIRSRYENRDKVIKVDVDPAKRISKISFGLSVCDSIVAMQFYDEDGELFVDSNWWDKRGYDPNIEHCYEGNYSADLKEWQTNELPAGHHVIGLKMHRTDQGDILRIGLVTSRSKN